MDGVTLTFHDGENYVVKRRPVLQLITEPLPLIGSIVSPLL